MTPWTQTKGNAGKPSPGARAQRKKKVRKQGMRKTKVPCQAGNQSEKRISTAPLIRPAEEVTGEEEKGER